MDEELLSETLEALSDRHTAKTASKSVTALKGVRGVPITELARLGKAAWHESPPNLDQDAAALTRLFGAAWEDGLLAIGLLAAALPDDPEAAWEIGFDWLDRVDDIATADALGWLVLGPSLLAMGRPVTPLVRIRGQVVPIARRAAIMAGMAMLPAPIEGPSAAPLRARLNQKHVQLVGEVLDRPLVELMDAYLRDESPEVRKAMRRICRVWSKADPASLVAWADTVKGGMPKLLGDEVRKARRRAAKADS